MSTTRRTRTRYPFVAPKAAHAMRVRMECLYAFLCVTTAIAAMALGALVWHVDRYTVGFADCETDSQCDALAQMIDARNGR